MLEQELSASQAALLNAGCLGPPRHPDCSHDFNTPTHGKITITGVICRKWAALSSEKTVDGQDVQTFLGNPTGPTQFVFQTNRELIVQYFDRGVIGDVQGSNSPAVVYGSIFIRYQEYGGVTGFLGVPMADEEAAPNAGRVSHFETGDIYWRADAGAHEIHGAIRGKFDDLAGAGGFLGYPTTDETKTPDGLGRFNHFQGGSIYWTPETGAHEVHGAIRDKWAALGWERSYLRYPTTDEMPTPDGNGRISTFQRGHIHINNENVFDVADAKVFDTGPMRASFVSGSAQLAITSNGFWSFRGNVHDAGFVGHNYAVGIAIDFRDAGGRAKAVTQEGSLHGTLAIGSRDDDWQQNGPDTPDAFLIDNWDALQNVGIKWTLHVSTSAIDVVETILFPLAAVVVAVAIILFVHSDDTKCTWLPGPDPNNPDDPNRPLVRCERN
jgi:uncharacterized protein with LGFP repeats